MCELEFVAEPPPASQFPEPTVCDPLIGRRKEIEIQPPVVVAQLDGERLLVLDRIDGGWSQMGNGGDYVFLTSRMFVSDGDTLVRVLGGLGGGQSTEKYIYDDFRADDESILGINRVERKPGVPPHIIPWETQVVVFDDGWPKDGHSEEEWFSRGRELPVLDECTVADMQVTDVPPVRRVEYVATDELGNSIVVTSSAELDSTYFDSFALFYGTPDAMLQRKVASVGREKDGGTTHISFELQGEAALLHFYVGCNGAFTHDCPGELEIGDTSYEVSIPDDDPTLIEGMTFLCHDA